MLKRRLALSYFLKSKDYLTDNLDRMATTSKVVAYLQTRPQFRIHDKTDFVVLGARIGILDIAMGAGFSDFSFLPRETVETEDPSATGAGATGRRRPCEEEMRFNDAIDGLVRTLRVIMSFIHDAGAAHMSRTECKGMFEKLSYRLEYATRTRPKPRKSLFDAGRAVAGANVETIHRFLQTGEEVRQLDAMAVDQDANNQR